MEEVERAASGYRLCVCGQKTVSAGVCLEDNTGKTKSGREGVLRRSAAFFLLFFDSGVSLCIFPSVFCERKSTGLCTQSQVVQRQHKRSEDTDRQAAAFTIIKPPESTSVLLLACCCCC